MVLSVDKSRCGMRVSGMRRAYGQVRDASKRDAKSLRADESSEIRVNEELRAHKAVTGYF